MLLTDYLRSAPFRIAAVYALLFVLSALLLFTAIYWSITREMTDELRSAIEQDMRPLVASYAEGRLDRLVQSAREQTAAAEPGTSFYQLRAPDGRVLAGNVPPLRPFEGWRELTLRLPGEEGVSEQTIIGLGVRLNRAFAFVGRSTSRLEETQALILGSLRWVILGTLVLSLAGGVLFAGSALRRVERINRAVHAIMLGDLSRRVPVGRSNDELTRLAGNINAMLDRIGELMESLRQVTNDIAHDLRTPLGRLRQRIETARMQADPADSRRMLDDAVVQIGDILETFNALLRIAQIEAGARKAQFDAVDLSDVARTIFEAYDSVAETDGRTLVASIDDGVRVEGDRDLLTQMLANLVENAIRHTPAGSQIALRLKQSDDSTLLAVTDTGPGIAETERARVLDRFYRLESSRTTPGSGLGLALVKAIVDLHDASLTLGDTTPGADLPGLTVAIRFTPSLPVA